MTLTLPVRYEYLTKTSKIIYNGKNLRTICLLYLINHIIEEYTDDNLIVPLYSRIIKHLYGNNYADYVEYLIETGFMEKASEYSSSEHYSYSYKMIDNLSEITICKKNDYKLNKNLTTHFLNLEPHKPFKRESPIPIEIRQKLKDDLQFITIDFEAAINYIDKYIKKNTKRNPKKYAKNLLMVHKINDNDLYSNPDEYGRFHSNFTNLNSEIRNRFLKIDGQPIGYLDIKSSQPFFLSQLLKRDPLLYNVQEVQRFIDIMEDDTQDIYLQFVSKYPNYFKSKDPKINRRKAKKLVIMSLFDHKSKPRIYKEIFRNEFPYIYDYMNNYSSDAFQELWSSLQALESEFIFNKVYISVIKQFPEIKLFTVHDSIYYPIKYEEGIKVIWDVYRLEMIKKKEKEGDSNIII